MVRALVQEEIARALEDLRAVQVSCCLWAVWVLGGLRRCVCGPIRDSGWVGGGDEGPRHSEREAGCLFGGVLGSCGGGLERVLRHCESNAVRVCVSVRASSAG